MKKQFLDFYDTSVDEVFSYYYKKTADRDRSLELVKEYFTETWDSIAPKASTIHDVFSKQINQFGY